MKRILPMAMLCCLCFASGGQAQTDTSRVIVLSGQSNMDGRADVGNLPDSLKSTPANIEFYLRNTNRALVTSGQFGPEVSFCHEIAKEWPEKKFLIVKYAEGGTSLPDWAPGGTRYNNLLAYVGNAVQGKTTVFAGMLWMQGERDSKSSSMAAQYADNLKALVDSIRADLNAPALPFAYGRVNPPVSSYPYTPVVRQAQEEAESLIVKTRMVDCDGLSKLSDNLHYNAEGQIELGQLFAQAFGELSDIASLIGLSPASQPTRGIFGGTEKAASGTFTTMAFDILGKRIPTMADKDKTANTVHFRMNNEAANTKRSLAR